MCSREKLLSPRTSFVVISLRLHAVKKWAVVARSRRITSMIWSVKCMFQFFSSSKSDRNDRSRTFLFADRARNWAIHLPLINFFAPVLRFLLVYGDLLEKCAPQQKKSLIQFQYHRRKWLRGAYNNWKVIFIRRYKTGKSGLICDLL